MKIPQTVLPLVLSLLPLALAPTACGSAPAVPAAPPAASLQPPVASPVASAAVSYPAPKIGTFGVDMAGMDRGARPGADFDAYVNGGWKKSTSIPADRTRWGMFDQLREQSDADVRAILEEAAKTNADRGTNAQKMGDFYSTYLDTSAIEARGLAPAKAALDRIAHARTLDDIARLMGSPDLPSDGPMGAGVSLDQKDPDHYIVRIGHSGLGLPEREYYLKTDAQFVDIRAKYLAHLKRLLELGGDAKSKKSAAADADAILALETKIADFHWPIADRRERDKTYNPRTLVELQKEAPEFPWKAFLVAEGYDHEPKFIVAEVTAIPKLAKLFKETPVATWKAYLTYHLLRATAELLPSALDKEVFDFYDHTLNGQPEQRERWKRAVAAVNGALGEAVGEIYVARHFPAPAKAAMDRLIENLRKAYGLRIEGVNWMTPDTKRVALEKLAAFRPKIGYPVKWKSYATLDVQPGDAFGNALRAAVWRHDYDLARLGKPSDRDEWRMTPQTVNAYYNAVFNEVVFPAAILQPPFFDPDADPAVNYGGIGGVIGHEMGHGFDDQGSKSDAKGVLRTWWSQADVDAFKKRTDTLADQYAGFEPLPGIKVNGRLTLGENIGDVGGLNVSYRAYQLSLEGQPAAVRDGFTGDQRFFLGWAQVWRALIRDQALRNQVMTDPHSPSNYRVNGVVRNVDAWYAAFDVKPDDPLYLPPENRVRIW
jgi:putative endopeptidase